MPTVSLNKRDIFKAMHQMEAVLEKRFFLHLANKEKKRFIHVRDDEQTPVFRLDAYLEKVSPLILKDILKDPHTMPQWFVRGRNSSYNQCIQGKLLKTEADGTEIFQNVFRSMQPLKQWHVCYRRHI